MSNDVRDVVIIGGGPAGTITAARLARERHDVTILEEHASVGSPVHCTGLLGLDAFDEFDLPRDIILGLAESAKFWGAAGQSVSIRSDKVRAAVIDRGALDTVLAARAEHAGARLLLGSRAESLTVTDDHVTITTRTGDVVETIRTRACVLACGANYRFHRPLGLGPPEVFLQSAQLETPFPESAPDVEVSFGRDVAPAGFAWLVPLQRGGVPHARIGLMSETRSRDRFAAFLQRLCDRAGVDAATVPAPRLKMLPLAPVARTYAARVLAVGDAAGLVKPTTGGGIYYGLLSGSLASEVLHDALTRDRLDEAYLRRYETRWRKRLGQEIKVGLAFRRIASALDDSQIDSLINLARVNGVVPLLQEKATFNWHRKAALALLADASFRKIVLKSWRVFA